MIPIVGLSDSATTIMVGSLSFGTSLEPQTGGQLSPLPFERAP